MILGSFSLQGRTALVTGCRRGLGLALATALAEAGADIVGVSAHLESDGGEAARAVRAAGRRFTGYACDLADRSALDGLIEAVRAGPAPIDILINNAGLIHRECAAVHATADWDRVLAVNLTTPFILSRELGRDMVARGSGRIIFISSLLAFQGGLTVPGYAASKGGAAQLVMALSNEWASHGVTVNAIAPGYMNTDATEALRADPVRASSILERIPVGRWGTPDDLKGAVVFLASPAAAYVTGTTLVVDGGWLGR